MRHQVKKNRLARPRGQRNLLLSTLATDLILHEKIKTTEAKAKALQPYIDKVMNEAKRPEKALAIRSVNQYLTNELSAKKLIEKIGKKYADKQSGYTRIVRLGFRSGDAAPLVQIELV